MNIRRSVATVAALSLLLVLGVVTLVNLVVVPSGEAPQGLQVATQPTPTPRGLDEYSERRWREITERTPIAYNWRTVAPTQGEERTRGSSWIGQARQSSPLIFAVFLLLAGITFYLCFRRGMGIIGAVIVGICLGAVELLLLGMLLQLASSILAVVSWIIQNFWAIVILAVIIIGWIASRITSSFREVAWELGQIVWEVYQLLQHRRDRAEIDAIKQRLGMRVDMLRGRRTWGDFGQQGQQP